MKFRSALSLSILLIGIGTPRRAVAQNLAAENPVFVNDSPAAADSLLQIEEHLANGNLDQAQRQIQQLLEDLPDALVPRRDDPACYGGVRATVLDLLRSDAALMTRYRRAQNGAAEAALSAGNTALVERSWLLTRSGFRAVLSLAAREIEAARFESAHLCLRQLVGHPDLGEENGALRREAVIVATVLSRYWPGATELVERLRGGDAAPAAGPRFEAPGFGPARSPLTPLPNGDLSGIVAQPLASAAFSGTESLDGRGGFGGGMMPDPDQVSPFLREPRFLPTLMGDSLFVPTSNGLSVFDRYTLQFRWGHKLAPLLGPDDASRDEPRGFRRRSGYMPTDDLRTVTVGRSLALVAAASEPNDAIDVREAVAAFEPAGGKVRWVTPMRSVMEDLKTAHIRGPILLDPGGTRAVVALRKDSPERRLRAFYLVALDAADGKPIWSALVGSVGILPYQPQPSLGDAATLHEGVVYASDRIGIACAYEAATGRPIWARRLAGETFENPIRLAAWQSSAPVVDGERVLIFSPDRRTLLTLDRATGREIARTPAPRTSAQSPGAFAYIMPAGERLIFVGDLAIASVSRSNPSASASVLDFEAPGIRGRVSLAGDRLLVPLDRAMAIVTLGETLSKTVQQLDESGNSIFIEDQLLVADDARVHSYLSWEAANRVLSERISTRAADPAPGVALAELAYRSSHDDRILVGVDAATSAIAALGQGEPDDYRTRLVASLRAMIDAAQAPRRIAGRPPVSSALQGELIDRLGAVSRTPTERSAVNLVLGKYREDHGSPELAAEAYQAVLDDPDLGAVMWQGARLGVRASTEATRRLEQLVASKGRGAYRKFEAEAAAAVVALPADASVEAMELLARRYPVAPAAPRLWERIAAAHERDKRTRAAARALEIGLQTAERIPDAPMEMVGELAGKLVSNLLDRGLAYAAEDALRRARTAFGEQLGLTRDGKPIDAGDLLGRIASDRAQFAKWPQVGNPIEQNAQVLGGWVLMEPVVREPGPMTASCLALKHQDGRIALFARVGPEDVLSEIWSVKTEAHQAELMRLDRSAATFYTAMVREGGSLLRVDTSTGRELWTTEPFSTHFAPAALPAAPLRGPAGRAAGVPGVGSEKVQTPLEGLKPINEVIFSSDERTLALVERSGRAVAFDADSGQRLWAASLPIAVVFDSATFRNLLAVAGEADVPAGEGEKGGGGGRSRAAQLVILDARTGDLLRTVPLDSTVRWVRFTPRGELVAGLGTAVIGIDPDTGGVTWTNSQPRCQNTLAAWAVGDSVFVQSETRQVWLLSGGNIRNDPVDTRDRLDSASSPRALFSQSGDLALATPQGLALVSPRGTLLGTDALGAGHTFLSPVATRDGFLLVESDAATRDRSAPAPFLMHKLDMRSAKLVGTTPLAIPEPPARLAAMEGRLAVSTTTGTVVLMAPPSER